MLYNHIRGGDYMIDTKGFSERLTQLRTQKGVSARDMSLSLGQNAGYINNIENGKNLPSMTVFFYICEYLNISPSSFFDIEDHFPYESHQLNYYLKKLTKEQLIHISAIIIDLTKI